MSPTDLDVSTAQTLGRLTALMESHSAASEERHEAVMGRITDLDDRVRAVELREREEARTAAASRREWTRGIAIPLIVAIVTAAGSVAGQQLLTEPHVRQTTGGR